MNANEHDLGNFVRFPVKIASRGDVTSVMAVRCITLAGQSQFFMRCVPLKQLSWLAGVQNTQCHVLTSGKCIMGGII